MAAKSKSSKKEEASVTLEAITTLLQEHREALAPEFKTLFSQLHLKDQGQRVTDLENPTKG